MDKMFEEKVVACHLQVKNFASISTAFLTSSLFTDPVLANIAKMSLDFYRQYETLLSNPGFSKAMSGLVNRKIVTKEEIPTYVTKLESLKSVDVSDQAFILDELTKFIKHQKTRSLIEKAVTDYLPKDKLDNLFNEMEAIRNITTAGKVEDIDYWSDERIRQRFERREREKTECIRGVTTGIKKLDDALHKGGWQKRELYAVLGDSKAGKTQMMLWMANAAAWAGYRVGYWTFETSTEVLEDRLDALNSQTAIRNVTAENKAIIEKMMEKKAPGTIHIFEYPTKTCTAANVRADLQRMANAGTPVDFAIFDYCDIARSERKYDSKWDEQVAVFEDFRALLGRPDKGGFDIPGLTGIQIGKGGSGKQIATATDGAGAYEKIAVLDGALTISGTEEDRKNNELYITLDRFRNAPMTTLKIKTDYEHGRFYKEYVQTAL